MRYKETMPRKPPELPANFFFSKRCEQELMELTGQTGPTLPEIDILHPAACPWLKEVLRDLRSEDEEIRMCGIFRIQGVLVHGPVSDGKTDAWAKYATYVLSQSVVIQELVRGLRDFGVSKRCYLVCKDDPRGGARIGTVRTYSNVLDTIAVDARAARFALSHFPDFVDVQLGNYYASRFPRAYRRARERCTIEFETKMFLTSSLCNLCAATKQGRERLQSETVFLNSILEDALEASEKAKPSDLAVGIVKRITQFRSPLETEETVAIAVKVAGNALESSGSAAGIESALDLVMRMIDEDAARMAPLLQRRKSISDSLLALELSSCPDEGMKGKGFEILLSANAKLQELDRRSFQVGYLRLPSDREMKAIQELAAKDHNVARRKKQLDAIFSPKASPGGEDHRSRDPAGKLTPMAGPRKQCARSDCLRVEATAREFKVCAQCKLVVYCSAECQKSAWKEGHKQECVRKPSRNQGM
ncbi:hypothetical protein KFL_001360070 [Klebsormidium nitens]|uniref:MYND-type domain-containing protein n=1 Tax=Klebsormidium nitens TaxID=105231 RepID=A0A1Y1HWS1_KLENI|nr:hypothetical protein KFL_001360070 [Klebsormidium nitens]|eukprot:GAQ83110.1 hypothetical protein KFL_001360070 [Klebsormidium nitens]